MADRFPSYLHDIGKSESDTETFVALKLGVANWRWASVPFYLRTGKRLPQRFSEIVVGFRKVPHVIFDMPSDSIPANRLVIRVQPDEGIKLWMMVKEPGPGGGMRLEHLPLDMSFAKAFAGQPSADAYERLLMDAIRGNAALFMRRDEVEAAWRFIDPIREAWASLARASPPLCRRHLGPERLGRADRARRADLERGVRRIRLVNITGSPRTWAGRVQASGPSDFQRCAGSFPKARKR